MNRPLLMSIGIVFSLSNMNSAYAESINSFLDKFYRNPAKMMERLPSRVDADGNSIPQGIIDHEVVAKIQAEKNRIRTQIISSSEDSGSFLPAKDMRDSLENKDEPERLVENGVLQTSNLLEMENRGLAKVMLNPTPWSDSYWPTYKGIAANRYADSSFPDSKSWQENYFYIQTHPASTIVNSGEASQIDRLSPAEKYDLAVGDANFSLTRWAWRKGEITFQEDGEVASWLGFCHGWAGGSHMMVQIPERPVAIMNPNGIPVTFYPQDIKALNAMLWANASPTTKFVGNRCNTPNPNKTRFGRVIDPACFDTNPATWHLALVNQIGINKRSFVMDSTFDYQVWNFPLAGYNYRYFNPLTRQAVPKLSLAAIPLSKYKLDPFKEFRSPNARYVVGVYMDVTHLNAITPTRRMDHGNAYETIRLVYDLELDENFNILGGEWFSNAHPDFIWTFDRSAQAMAAEDSRHISEGWISQFPVPNTWSTSAMRASARGEPLASFILGLRPQ